MGKPGQVVSADWQIDVRRAKSAEGGSSPSASRGQMHSIAGRPASDTGGQQPQHRSIRGQQPRAVQQHSWLQRLRLCGGPQKPYRHDGGLAGERVATRHWSHLMVRPVTLL